MFRGDLARGPSSPALVAVGQHGIQVWRGAALKKQVELQLPRKLLSISRAVLSEDARVAAALYAGDGGVGDPDAVGIWDAQSGALRTEVQFRGGRVLGATLSPDGKLLALHGDVKRREALLRLYRLEDKRTRLLLDWSSAKDRTTFCAAFAPGGQRLALCSGKRLVLFDVKRRREVAATPTARVKGLFPKSLRRVMRMPGAHMVAFSHDGRELVTVHALGVVGVARWSVKPLAPKTWIKRPATGGTMRAVAWGSGRVPWLLTASYGPRVWLHAPRGDRYRITRTFAGK
jgi:hypothetical protein